MRFATRELPIALVPPVPVRREFIKRPGPAGCVSSFLVANEIALSPRQLHSGERDTFDYRARRPSTDN